ncbi:saf domain-containing protein [Penicillium capsulatum]|uniref:Saf domain-containing protein n=1 Tax=Penicillium capsulatum TaxID=69766 RepID=A0A9W9IV52_9EURO|nr:saf domain-containing protein [Penicillium capsulatum]
MTNLSTKLAQLEATGKPIQVGIIGAGKFGSMYISQSHRTTGVRLAGIADLSAQRAYGALKRTGFPEEKYDTTSTLSIEEGIKANKTAITTDSTQLIAAPGIDVILEVTGNPAAGVRHALLCCEHKKHIVMINVEADVLAGPLLTRKAKEAGVIYSMAYGDQPALIAEMVDWARTAGFDVVCAGKGTKHLPEYHYSTPDTIWTHYGFTEEQLASGDFNPQMFNSFLDGTKSALEMSAVANGCGLSPPTNGLAFPPGGQLEKYGTVEVVSCLEKDGRAVFNDLRWGVYVIIEGNKQPPSPWNSFTGSLDLCIAPGKYQQDCFAQYGLQTDKSGRFAAQYKPYHLIGLELGISIATIMCRGEPTGQCKTFAGDVVATAKRELKVGEKLDGEGGFMVYGKLMPAEASLAIEGLPIGLAHGLILKRDVRKDQGLSWEDVDFGVQSQAVAVRREMEALFREEFKQAGKNTNGN